MVGHKNVIQPINAVRYCRNRRIFVAKNIRGRARQYLTALDLSGGGYRSPTIAASLRDYDDSGLHMVMPKGISASLTPVPPNKSAFRGEKSIFRGSEVPSLFGQCGRWAGGGRSRRMGPRQGGINVEDVAILKPHDGAKRNRGAFCRPIKGRQKRRASTSRRCPP